MARSVGLAASARTSTRTGPRLRGAATSGRRLLPFLVRHMRPDAEIEKYSVELHQIGSLVYDRPTLIIISGLDTGLRQKIDQIPIRRVFLDPQAPFFKSHRFLFYSIEFYKLLVGFFNGQPSF